MIRELVFGCVGVSIPHQADFIVVYRLQDFFRVLSQLWDLLDVGRPPFCGILALQCRISLPIVIVLAYYHLLSLAQGLVLSRASYSVTRFSQIASTALLQHE